MFALFFPLPSPCKGEGRGERVNIRSLHSLGGDKSEVGVLGYGNLPPLLCSVEVTCLNRRVGSPPCGTREGEEGGRGAPPIL